MTIDRSFWVRLYVGGLIFCVICTLVFNLYLGYGFVDSTVPGPTFGPSSPLSGVSRGEYDLWYAIEMVLVLHLPTYVFDWTIVFAFLAIGTRALRWIGLFPKVDD